MTQDDQDLQELVQDFVTEAREHLGHVEGDLLNLEANATEDPETVNRVFRAVHSVKGVAGFLGFETINRLAHSLESVLDLVRKDRLGIDADLVDALLQSLDQLRELVEDVHGSNAADVGGCIARLQVYLQSESSAGASRAGHSANAPVLEAGEAVVEVDVVPASLALGMNCALSQVPERVAAVGRIVRGATELVAVCEQDLPSRDSIRLGIATRMPVEAVQERLGLTRQPPAAAPEPTTQESAPQTKSSKNANAAPPARGKEGGGEGQHESIRVSVSLLDRLMNLSGELVLSRNQLLQARQSSNDKACAVACGSLNQVVSEMQEAIMQTRMQPVASLFQRFPRVLRDLAGKLGKRCTLVLEGRDVDLDRTILEGLSDPLTHLVRNAIDHGVELPARRKAAGKPEEGTLRLGAVQQGGNVCITIADDGGGIDPARLRAKAAEKGLYTEAQLAAMSDREAVNLIFAPGFSTAEKVTDVSGRGVGMDVVRSNIEKLGGHVEVRSVLGRGTTILVTIPLTLAILPAMVVSAGDCRFVLAQANVAELVRASSAAGEDRIVRLDGREVLRLRGRVLPLLRLRERLGVPASTAARSEEIVLVVEVGLMSYGLVIDAPPDAEEIVVKPLGRHLKDRPEYAGATILGDGRVALILDAAGIAEAAGLEATREEDSAAVAMDATALDHADFVLFRNHATETYAVPLGLVDRIQRVETDRLLEVGGRTVLAEGERVLPILRLERVIDAKAPELQKKATIVFARIGDRQVGVLASEVEDICRVSAGIDDLVLGAAGVLGSFQSQERTVRVLDVCTLVRTGLPHVLAKEDVAATVVDEGERRPLRVLFAEDTRFFREHVKRTLDEAGFDVVAAADGELAWAELQASKLPFDVVVTDVQMPNCDGLELCRRIRSSPAHAALPVVALTSLSSAEDEAQGRGAGVDAYLVKLDDETLVRSVEHFARRRS